MKDLSAESRIYERTSNGIGEVFLSSKLLADRIIFLTGDIDHEMANNMLQKIIYLRKQDAKKPIKLIINSNGGLVEAGLMLFDIIHESETPIYTICCGCAYSMAAIIFAAGNKRFILPNSRVMCHEPLISGSVGGSSTTMKSISDGLMSTKRKMDRILSELTGKTLKVIAKATAYDHYFSASEAVEFGLCDKIITVNEMLEVTRNDR